MTPKEFAKEMIKQMKSRERCATSVIHGNYCLGYISTLSSLLKVLEQYDGNFHGPTEESWGKGAMDAIDTINEFLKSWSKTVSDGAYNYGEGIFQLY